MLGSWISLSDVGREFQGFGAAMANVRFLNVLVNEWGCVKIGWLADRRARLGYAAPVAQINIQEHSHGPQGMSAAISYMKHCIGSQ